MSERKKQICVIGLGHFGWELALTLASTCEVLAIDRNRELIDEIGDKVHRALALDIRDEAALASVIPDTIDEAIISMGESLESSILCTLYLKRLKVPVIRAKALSDDHATLLRQVGADEIIFPERETANRLAARVAHPNLLDFVPLGGDYQAVEVKPSPVFDGHSLAELNLRARFNVFGIAVQKAGAAAKVFLPGPDYRFDPGDALFVIGQEKGIQELLELAQAGGAQASAQGLTR
jgi:trk system potassium uptake protein TrkA